MKRSGPASIWGRWREPFGSLQVSPFHHWQEDRVRSHAFLCMPACYMEWHMRHHLAPLLSAGEDPQPGMTLVASPVRSQTATTKQGRRHHQREDLPASGFKDLLQALNGPCAADIDMGHGHAIPVMSKPTALHRRVFQLLGGNIHAVPGEARYLQKRASVR